VLPARRKPLPFLCESTGVETYFANELEARSRRVFAFHRLETLAEWAGRGGPGQNKEYKDDQREGVQLNAPTAEIEDVFREQQRGIPGAMQREGGAEDRDKQGASIDGRGVHLHLRRSTTLLSDVVG
jgi:hypothetical protein